MKSPITAQITFLDTHDLKKTHAFYADCMGLTLVLDQGQCRLYKIMDNAYVGFCLRDRDIDPSGVIITIVTDDVDSWYGDLKSKNTHFESTPKFNPDYNITHFFLKDPNGYLVEIQRFEDPNWDSHLHLSPME